MSGNKKNIARHSIVRGLAVSVAVFAFSTAHAYADSTFLLQFGSFNTQDQATQKWQDIKSKNADVVGRLNLHVAEVALPPDNTIMYRTQAGPVASRTQASSLCSTLKTRDVDCFVVETALFTAEPLPAQAQSDFSPSLPTLPPLTVTSPIVAETPAVVSKPVASATQTLPVPSLAANVSEPSSIPRRAVPAESSEENDKPGFFGRLFGTSSTPAPAPAPVAAPVKAAAVPVPAPTKTVAAATVVPVSAAPSAPITYISNDTPPVKAIAPSRNFNTAADTESVPFPIPTSTPALARPAPVSAPSEPVFVPAPPVHAHDTMESETPVTRPMVMDTPPVIMPASSHPTSDWVVPGREPKNLNQLVSHTVSTPVTSASTGSSNVVGDVKVAEAIRVPLGSGGKPKKVVILPPVHGMGGVPSATTHKTYWAQLSYFADEERARNFYDKFHADYPQFSDGVRIRITHPYSNSAGRVSLRVGPFVGTDDVHTICKAAAERNVSCTIVKEVGTSSSSSTIREHTLYHSSTQAVSVPTESSPVNDVPKYWLQLGTFHSPDDAWDNWKELQGEHKKLLRKAHADVSAPSMSSAQRALYRLRIGPYTSESSADSFCDNLEDAGVSCILVNDK